ALLTFPCSLPARHLPSFPTRRSSDLADPVDLGTGDFAYRKTDLVLPGTMPMDLTRTHIQGDTISRPFGVGMTWSLDINLFSENRSEEHTSELQSLRHLVCRLLLEKKK